MPNWYTMETNHWHIQWICCYCTFLSRSLAFLFGTYKFYQTNIYNVPLTKMTMATMTMSSDDNAAVKPKLMLNKTDAKANIFYTIFFSSSFVVVVSVLVLMLLFGFWYTVICCLNKCVGAFLPGSNVWTTKCHIIHFHICWLCECVFVYRVRNVLLSFQST